MGITEFLVNRAFYWLDRLTTDVLYLFPTDGDASDFSAGRFDVALELSPYLARLFTDVKNVGHKRAGGVNFYCRGSMSRTKVKAIPVGLLIVDEYDEMNQRNLPLARERLSGQRDPHEVDGSTPTISDFGIWLEWLESEQWRWVIPCPICGKRQYLTFEENLVIPDVAIFSPKESQNEDNSGRPPVDEGIDIGSSDILIDEQNGDFSTETSGHNYHYRTLTDEKHENQRRQLEPKALTTGIQGQDGLPYFRCALCGKKWLESERLAAIRAGNWQCAKKSTFLKRGYHISQLYSATQTAVSIARVYAEAEITADEIKKTEFFNSKLGMPYESKGARLSSAEIRDCVISGFHAVKSPYTSTAGIDVSSAGRHYVEIADWSQGLKRVLDIKKAMWDELPVLLAQYKVRCCVIDSMPERAKARELAEKYPGAVYLAFYPEGLKSLFMVNEETKIVNIHRTEGMERTLNRFRTHQVIVPFDLELMDEYVKQLCAPVKVYRINAKGIPMPRYIEGSMADHFAHASVYNEIAGMISPYISSNIVITEPEEEGVFMI